MKLELKMVLMENSGLILLLQTSNATPKFFPRGEPKATPQAGFEAIKTRVRPYQFLKLLIHRVAILARDDA